MKILVALALVFLFVGQASAINAEDGLSVITGTQVTYSLTVALLKDTDIETVNIPADGRRFDALKDYIARRTDQLGETFAAADAVVSMTNVLSADPIYRFARQFNINIVNIDAAQPWSFNASGVTVVEVPNSNVDWFEPDDEAGHATANSPYFWLSLSNAVRMADLVGSDLARVFPIQQKTILANRNQLKQDLLAISREYQNKFIEVADNTVFALSDEFVYLTNDFALYVDGYFIKQDINWTDADVKKFCEYLKRQGIKTVIHKWQPDERITAAINEAGAQLVILNNADPGLAEDRKLIEDGYQQILRSNLEALYQAMNVVVK